MWYAYYDFFLEKNSCNFSNKNRNTIKWVKQFVTPEGETDSCIIPQGRYSLYTWGRDCSVHLLMNVHISNLFIYKNSPSHKDCVSTFPPLIWRDVGDSKHHSKSFKLFSSKRFGEDVYNFLICGTMTEMDCFGINMMSNQMIFSIDVFRSIMEFWVLLKPRKSCQKQGGYPPGPDLGWQLLIHLVQRVRLAIMGPVSKSKGVCVCRVGWSWSMSTLKLI